MQIYILFRIHKNIGKAMQKSEIRAEVALAPAASLGCVKNFITHKNKVETRKKFESAEHMNVFA